MPIVYTIRPPHRPDREMLPYHDPLSEVAYLTSAAKDQDHRMSLVVQWSFAVGVEMNHSRREGIIWHNGKDALDSWILFESMLAAPASKNFSACIEFKRSELQFSW